jgi:Ala-tRNA(Pro) deacylase
MAILSSLQRLLDDAHVHYEVHEHRLALTAVETATADNVPPSEMVEVVVVCGSDRLLMAALPASHTLDLDCLRDTVGDETLRLASEREFAGVFPACELGAIPPFGQLFGMPLWVDDSLGREKETAFSGGNHHETVHLAYPDYVRLAKPQFGSFSRRGDATQH